MTKVKHPNNKAERLLNAQKKEHDRKVREDRAGAVRAKLAREALKAQETEDEVRRVLEVIG